MKKVYFCWFFYQRFLVLLEENHKCFWSFQGSSVPSSTNQSLEELGNECRGSARHSGIWQRTLRWSHPTASGARASQTEQELPRQTQPGLQLGIRALLRGSLAFLMFQGFPDASRGLWEAAAEGESLRRFCILRAVMNCDGQGHEGD